MSSTNYFCPKCHSLLHNGVCNKCSNNDKKSKHKKKNKCVSNQKSANAWLLKTELYDWQKEAVDKWCNNDHSGIMKVITGAGKTILAMKLISLMNDYCKGKHGIKIFVVVPKLALVEQWKNELINKLNLMETDISILQGQKSYKHINSSSTIYISTINTAREVLPFFNNFFKKTLQFNTFLIADECHGYGSEINSNIFSTSYDYTLGLSATPERTSDWGFEAIIVPNLGKVVYEYDYSRAVNDGVVSPFELINCEIDFTLSEQREYDDISMKMLNLSDQLHTEYPELNNSGDDFFKILNSIYNKNNDDRIEMFISLSNKRRFLSHSAEHRTNTLIKILDAVSLNKTNPKILIFHEMIDCANETYDTLRRLDYNAGIYHSKIDKNDREIILSNYKDDSIDILVTCKALDEGLDVPRTNIGIIVSSTKTQRQFIQRIGRVLRKSDGKKFSQIFYINIPKVDSDYHILGLNNIENDNVIDFELFLSFTNPESCDECLYKADCISNFFKYCIFTGKEVTWTEDDRVQRRIRIIELSKSLNLNYDFENEDEFKIPNSCDDCGLIGNCEYFIYCPHHYKKEQCR